MEYSSYVYAFIGGSIIGLGATWMMLFNGRIAGISGITHRIFLMVKGDEAWRIGFVLGMVIFGFIMSRINPDWFGTVVKLDEINGSKLIQLSLAGLLVGFGSTLGNGCTSGHGVCGIARMAPRSIVATISFMTSGVLIVFILRLLGVIA